MNDQTIRKDISVLLVIMVVFIAILAGLKVYDHRTGEVKKLGTKIMSSYI